MKTFRLIILWSLLCIVSCQAGMTLLYSQTWQHFECKNTIGCVAAGILACGQPGGQMCIVTGGSFKYCSEMPYASCDLVGGGENATACSGINPSTYSLCYCSMIECK